MIGNRRAILLDRQPLWLEAVDGVLRKNDVTVVGKTTTPTIALELVRTHQPDIIVTGIRMADGEMDGIEFITKAREAAPAVRAVALSAYTEPHWIDRAIEAGAVAYVIKSAHPDDLASAIRQAFELSMYFAGARPALSTTRANAHAEDMSELTRREREILRLVAEGYSNAKLAKMLWVTEQTVKFHLSNVYRKLDVANRTEAARWAQRSGLLDEPFESAYPVHGTQAATA